MKSVDDYMREAWKALLAGDTKRRDELVNQAERLLRAEGDAWQRQQSEQPIRVPVRAVIHLPDRSHEVLS